MKKATFLVSKNMYLPQVVLKASYAFISDVYIHIDELKESWIISFSPKNEYTDVSAFPGLFENELISQAVRWNVYQQTHSVRELLMARAMTSTMIDDADPLERVSAAQSDVDSEELNTILTNWFERYEKEI